MRNPNIEACPRENGDPKQIQNTNIQNQNPVLTQLETF